ncbi:MAG: PQQ-dependent sugar dehydrogenase [Candidatus Binatia bacterium]
MHKTFKAPAFAWLPSVAPSGLTLIEGFHETWGGDLLRGTLKDQSLYRIHIHDKRVMFAERIPVNKRIRYVHQHSHGRLVLWTDDNHIIFLSVDERRFTTEFIDRHIESSGYSDLEKRKVESAVNSCRQCHSFDPGDQANAPSLGAIFDSTIAATGYSGYSEALKGRCGRWSRAEPTGVFERSSSLRARYADAHPRA